MRAAETEALRFGGHVPRVPSEPAERSRCEGAPRRAAAGVARMRAEAAPKTGRCGGQRVAVSEPPVVSDRSSAAASVSLGMKRACVSEDTVNECRDCLGRSAASIVRTRETPCFMGAFSRLLMPHLFAFRPGAARRPERRPVLGLSARSSLATPSVSNQKCTG